MTLNQLTDANGKFGVLAIDHRDSLRAFLRPGDPDSISAAEITQLKIELVREVSPAATGVMLEPEYSIPQVIDAGVLPMGIGFTAALESQGYLAATGSGPTTVLEGWSPALAAASGAACAKLLLPYHPDRPLAAVQEAVAADVLAQCRAAGIPLVLEPLFYGLDDPSDRTRVVIATAMKFSGLNPDLLKLPFPVDQSVSEDRDHWFAACRTISELVPMPWVMLSGGGSFEDYRASNSRSLSKRVARASWSDERCGAKRSSLRPGSASNSCRVRSSNACGACGRCSLRRGGAGRRRLR